MKESKDFNVEMCELIFFSFFSDILLYSDRSNLKRIKKNKIDEKIIGIFAVHKIIRKLPFFGCPNI